ncbi:MAG: SMC-Scp complex subunit ScpB [Phycisphaerales bacterium]|nr:SMC-Scp complex subunit ScpB [Phycisphaerales bacterium]
MTYEPNNNQGNGLPADLDGIDAAARVEAVLVTSERPVREARLVEATELSAADVRAAIASLNDTYEDSNRVFRITAVADGWQMLTLPEVAPVLARLLAARQQARLSQAAMETLSIIAYRQPVLRAEIEAIRGVACGEVLRGLLERRLIRIAGRAEELGRPMLYGTTREFLRIFGLSGIDDLPEVDGLQRAPSWTPLAREPDDSSESSGPEVVDTVEATPTPEA